ncbi:hypothetical protein HZI73_19895 [Vallitalea pronyensis]|uniref:Uncharacterized protein n=1 Tax=Vallitalea pronyensis TaxID=1348613 RepID=A0A8J8MMT5_9FIRM|nr:hypothetical protein [Vallitalea pronyensis]QUI24421.1 hypothetical protein HZI73_19895 [Vallitalea pronyensis]
MQQRKLEGLLSIVLGSLGLILWLLPIAGIGVSILGLTLGIIAYGSYNKYLGISGIMINVIVLLLIIIRSGLVALLT